MEQCSTLSWAPARNLTPLRPAVVPAPLIDMLRSVTLAVFGVAVRLSLMTKPLMPPLLSVLPQPAPVVPSTVSDLVMVSVP
jgi:hypothetical protein